MDIPDEHIPQVIKALDFYAAYLKTVMRDDRPYLEAIEAIKKPPAKETGTVAGKKKRA